MWKNGRYTSLLSSPFFARLTVVSGVLGLLCSGLLSNPAQAQSPTPVTSIVNGDSGTALEATYSGGLLAPGKFADLSNYSAPNDSIPATGAGTRMMWYPEKAAFRAGNISGAEWDAGNVGTYSAAFGKDTRAEGSQSTAMGVGTTAKGSAASAFGAFTTASGQFATTLGTATEANTTHSLSVGVCNDANTSNDGTLFVVGNGSDPFAGCSTRSDALVLDENGNLTTAGNVNGTSDRRLKKRIAPLEEGILQKLSELRPVRYQFKNQNTHPSGNQIGLIAQDVRKEFPALVTEDAGGMLSLAYPKMTAVLLKGIQEQQDQLEEKQAQIDSLRERLREMEALKAENEEIKNRLAALEAERRPSTAASLTGSNAGLLLAFLLGGLLGAGLLWRRRG